eukprot:TRINITY_DN3364_c0_g1_i1.p1 TRINITY_DN3364_c0_g1~~TRINITY_DN3364_c0_g1_i1.p1  ORF type:complete len:478 (-),score=126.95 TRINITY_DN3364_c0_g1_i1:46-1479(-)
MVKRAPACALVVVGCIAAPVSAFIPRSSGIAVCRSGACSSSAAHRPQHISVHHSLLNARRARRVSSLEMSQATPEPLNIGLFGGGTVGGGVYEICEESNKDFLAGIGADVKISKICVRDTSKARDFSIGAHTTVVSDYKAILEDDSINCVVELMGGVTSAKDVVFEAIKRGKHVVTANKALLAQYLPEIQELLKQHPEVHFAYEAAVCGGIPIINVLQNDFFGDKISKICGIMNGTTNFMLSKMESEGADYDDVLKEAQALGYAEADPTADVEGLDVQAKIALLAKLAFGATVPVDTVPCQGISQLSSADFEFARMMRSTIKLLGTAMLNADGSKLSVFVSPVVVPLTSPIAGARGAGNIVVVNSRNVDTTSYSGPGAGRFPTANSVVSDIVRIARGMAMPPFPYDKDWTFETDFTGEFYTRITCKDALGIIKRVGELAEENGVSIHAILQPRPLGVRQVPALQVVHEALVKEYTAE